MLGEYGETCDRESASAARESASAAGALLVVGVPVGARCGRLSVARTRRDAAAERQKGGAAKFDCSEYHAIEHSLLLGLEYRDRVPPQFNLPPPVRGREPTPPESYPLPGYPVPSYPLPVTLPSYPVPVDLYTKYLPDAGLARLWLP